MLPGTKRALICDYMHQQATHSYYNALQHANADQALFFMGRFRFDQGTTAQFI